MRRADDDKTTFLPASVREEKISWTTFLFYFPSLCEWDLDEITSIKPPFTMVSSFQEKRGEEKFLEKKEASWIHSRQRLFLLSAPTHTTTPSLLLLLFNLAADCSQTLLFFLSSSAPTTFSHHRDLHRNSLVLSQHNTFPSLLFSVSSVLRPPALYQPQDFFSLLYTNESSLSLSASLTYS